MDTEADSGSGGSGGGRVRPMSGWKRRKKESFKGGEEA